MTASAPPWRAIGASVRGASHERDELPNQDAFSVEVGDTPDGSTAVAAVADGHGGARHFRSADGARLAVAAAREVLEQMTSRFVEATSADRARLAAVELPQRIVSRWVELARADLTRRSFTRHEWAALEASEGSEGKTSVREDPLLAYGATLLAALAVPGCLVLLQLGDGDVLVVDAHGRTRRPVPHDERLAGNITTSICRVGAEADFRCVVLEGEAASPSLVLLSTDGYANSFRSDIDYLKVGSDFLGLLRQHGIGTVERQLPSILEHASQHGSGDDITLAMLVGRLAVPIGKPPPADEPGHAGVRPGAARRRQAVAAAVVAGVVLLWWAQRGPRGSDPSASEAGPGKAGTLVVDDAASAVMAAAASGRIPGAVVAATPALSASQAHPVAAVAPAASKARKAKSPAKPASTAQATKAGPNPDSAP